jgi:hypothetical protein
MRLDARELPEGTGDAAPDDIGPPQDVMRPSGTWYAISVPRVSCGGTQVWTVFPLVDIPFAFYPAFGSYPRVLAGSRRMSSSVSRHALLLRSLSRCLSASRYRVYERCRNVGVTQRLLPARRGSREAIRRMG